MFGEALSLLIILLAATNLSYFPATPLFLECTVNSRIPPPGLFSPPEFFGRPEDIINCLQQTGLRLFPDLFCPSSTSIARGRLCNESLLVWKRLAPWGPRCSDEFLLCWGRDDRREISDQQGVLVGDLLARDNLDISHMLAEGLIKEHIVRVFLSPEMKMIIWLDRFLKQVLPMTRLQDMANPSKLSPSVFLVPQPCPPCTPTYTALHSPSRTFQSSTRMRIIEVGISATTGWSSS